MTDKTAKEMVTTLSVDLQKVAAVNMKLSAAIWNEVILLRQFTMKSQQEWSEMEENQRQEQLDTITTGVLEQISAKLEALDGLCEQALHMQKETIWTIVLKMQKDVVMKYNSNSSWTERMKKAQESSSSFSNEMLSQIEMEAKLAKRLERIGDNQNNQPFRSSGRGFGSGRGRGAGRSHFVQTRGGSSFRTGRGSYRGGRGGYQGWRGGYNYHPYNNHNNNNNFNNNSYSSNRGNGRGRGTGRDN